MSGVVHDHHDRFGLRFAHDFRRCDGFDVWKCVGCHMSVQKERTLKTHQNRACRPMASRDVKHCLTATNFGHKMARTLLCTDVHMCCPIYVCQICGSHARRQFRSLLRPCRGRGASSSWQRFFVFGKEPRGGKSVVAFQKLRVPVVLDPEEHAVHGLFGGGSTAGIAQLPSIRAAGMLDVSQASVISESD